MGATASSSHSSEDPSSFSSSSSSSSSCDSRPRPRSSIQRSSLASFLSGSVDFSSSAPVYPSAPAVSSDSVGRSSSSLPPLNLSPTGSALPPSPIAASAIRSSRFPTVPPLASSHTHSLSHSQPAAGLSSSGTPSSNSPSRSPRPPSRRFRDIDDSTSSGRNSPIPARSGAALSPLVRVVSLHRSSFSSSSLDSLSVWRVSGPLPSSAIVYSPLSIRLLSSLQVALWCFSPSHRSIKFANDSASKLWKSKFSDELSSGMLESALTQLIEPQHDRILQSIKAGDSWKDEWRLEFASSILTLPVSLSGLYFPLDGSGSSDQFDLCLLIECQPITVLSMDRSPRLSPLVPLSALSPLADSSSQSSFSLISSFFFDALHHSPRCSLLIEVSSFQSLLSSDFHGIFLQNPSSERCFGSSRRLVSDYFEDFSPILAHLTAAAGFAGEAKVKSLSGARTHDVELRCLTVLNHNFVFILSRDVSNERETLSRLLDSISDAENAARSKADFLAVMSHEIRTPVNGILGMVDLLLMSSLTEEQVDFAQTIQVCSDSLLSIINDILDFSKSSSGALELENRQFPLHVCVEESLEILGLRAAEKRIEFTYVIDPALPSIVVGDSGRLKQVCVNLLSNAVKFSHPDSQVHLYVERIQDASKPDDSGMLPLASPPGPGQVGVQFRVVDHGLGIKPENMTKLFQAFSQANSSTTRKYGGTGLGLVICKSLVEQMGGRIYTRSIYREGSSFIFNVILGVTKRAELRLAHANAESQQQTNNSLPSPTSRGPLSVKSDMSPSASGVSPTSTPPLCSSPSEVVTDRTRLFDPAAAHRRSRSSSMTVNSGSAALVSANLPLSTSSSAISAALFHPEPEVPPTLSNDYHYRDHVARERDDLLRGKRVFILEKFPDNGRMTEILCQKCGMNTDRKPIEPFSFSQPWLEYDVLVVEDEEFFVSSLVRQLSKLSESQDLMPRLQPLLILFMSSSRTVLSRVKESWSGHSSPSGIEIKRKSSTHRSPVTAGRSIVAPAVQRILNPASAAPSLISERPLRIGSSSCLFSMKTLRKPLKQRLVFSALVNHFKHQHTHGLCQQTLKFRDSTTNSPIPGSSNTSSGPSRGSNPARSSSRSLSSSSRSISGFATAPMGVRSLPASISHAPQFSDEFIHSLDSDAASLQSSDESGPASLSVSQSSSSASSRLEEHRDHSAFTSATAAAIRAQAALIHAANPGSGPLGMRRLQSHDSDGDIEELEEMGEGEDEADPEDFLSEHSDSDEEPKTGGSEPEAVFAPASGPIRLKCLQTYSSNESTSSVGPAAPDSGRLHGGDSASATPISTVRNPQVSYSYSSVSSHAESSSPRIPPSLLDSDVDRALRPKAAIDTSLSHRYPLRILLAEDSIINQKVANSLLSRLGYSVEIVENGLQAVEAVSSLSPSKHDFDLVFMDLEMPQMGGLEASAAIRSAFGVPGGCVSTSESLHFRGRRCPILIAMTARVLEEDREKCAASGMADFIAKPISIQSLQSCIEKWGALIQSGDEHAIQSASDSFTHRNDQSNAANAASIAH